MSGFPENEGSLYLSFRLSRWAEPSRTFFPTTPPILGNRVIINSPLRQAPRAASRPPPSARVSIFPSLTSALADHDAYLRGCEDQERTLEIVKENTWTLHVRTRYHGSFLNIHHERCLRACHCSFSSVSTGVPFMPQGSRILHSTSDIRISFQAGACVCFGGNPSLEGSSLRGVLFAEHSVLEQIPDVQR